VFARIGNIGHNRDGSVSTWLPMGYDPRGSFPVLEPLSFRTVKRPEHEYHHSSPSSMGVGMRGVTHPLPTRLRSMMLRTRSSLLII
jgi:hypothetical protein